VPTVVGVCWVRDCVAEAVAMPQRNLKNVSFGVFSTSASASFLTKEENNRHFFTSCNTRDFYAREINEEDRGENMIHVHNAGKTYGKYLPYKRNTAPLLDRSFCHYTGEYNKKPCITLQAEGNKALATSFGPMRFKNAPKIAIGATKSKSSIDFCGQKDVAEMRNAKPPLWKGAAGGELADVVGGKGKMMVTVSHNQWTHSGPREGAFEAKGAAFEAVKDSLHPQGYHGGDFGRSSYQKEYNGENQKRNQLVGSAFRMGDHKKLLKSASATM